MFSVTRLGNFSNPVATIILPKLHPVVGNFVKVSKTFVFLVQSLLGNFYSNLATFYWSHCCCSSLISGFKQWVSEKIQIKLYFCILLLIIADKYFAATCLAPFKMFFHKKSIFVKLFRLRDLILFNL